MQLLNAMARRPRSLALSVFASVCVIVFSAQLLPGCGLIKRACLMRVDFSTGTQYWCLMTEMDSCEKNCEGVTVSEEVPNTSCEDHGYTLQCGEASNVYFAGSSCDSDATKKVAGDRVPSGGC